MVTRIRTEPSLLLITFETNGEEPEQELRGGSTISVGAMSGISA
jgi:hypothetical protein